MNKKRQGKYPNFSDFDPYFNRTALDEEKLYELPLADPSETLPADAYQAREINEAVLNLPSAFSVNRKKQLEPTS